MQNGQVYSSLLEARRDGVRVYLDGQLICHWKTTYADGSVTERWRLRNSRFLGVGAYQATTTFQKIRLIEIAGKGRTVPRPDDLKLK